MLLFGITLITLGSVIPGLKEKFNFDELTSGTLFSILPIGILTGSLIFGPFCDKYGYKLMLVISCIGMFAGFEGIAYASSPFLLKICIYLFGLSGGIINGATNALVADISIKDKTANLSLLGVFFAIGALGMPFILGILKDYFSFETIVAAVGFLALLTGLISLSIQFPAPKLTLDSPVHKSFTLLQDKVLLLIAFFLFFQSSLEAIIHNWITIYLMAQLAVKESNALYALSLNVVGMAVMRLLTGSLFRKVPPKKILNASLVMMLAGSGLLQLTHSFTVSVIALIILGGGMAGGFPIMLAFVGDRYKEISGTAFSFVFVIALIGNMLLNYLMGMIAHSYGISYLTVMVICEILAMIILSTFILKKIKT